MTKIVCVLRSGGDFGPEHVAALRKSVAPHAVICLVDAWIADDVPEPKVLMKHDWPGWWAKMNVMDGSAVSGDILYTDLDVIIRDLSGVLAACHGDMPIMLEDFLRRGGLQSSLMYLPKRHRLEAWQAFLADAPKIMDRFQRGGDQQFLETLWLGDAKRWQDVLPEQIVSYKKDCAAGVPPDARVIIFHGAPRPWDTELWHV